jgi:hypothetical protein
MGRGWGWGFKNSSCFPLYQFTRVGSTPTLVGLVVRLADFILVFNVFLVP